MSDKNIERRIVIGLISSTEYIQEIRELYNSKFIEASMAKRLSRWCMEYYDKYSKAPGMNIEGIYHEKLKEGLPEDIAEEIEDEILPDLNEEFIDTGINVDYLVDQTAKYFSERKLELHSEQIKALLTNNELVEADILANNYKPLERDTGNAVNFSDEKILDKIDKAFEEAQNPLVTYPGALGRFWNHQFVRGGFVTFMGPEKRGKTFLLMDFITRAAKQKIKVAFFQAGDMSENQQIRRFAIHLAKKSDKKKYCGKQYQPEKDCIHNQRDTCSKDVRECDFGIFDHLTEDQVRKEITIDQLREALEENPEYSPCYNCKEYTKNKWGATWIKEIFIKNPLSAKEAKEAWTKFFIQNKRNVMMSTHANGTLTFKLMNSILDLWEKVYNFTADAIVLDYMDITDGNGEQDTREKENNKWKNARAMSQTRHVLFLSVTQTDSDSYEKKILKMKNFSEDKRKHGHVTATYGLNQDPDGREKKIGIMRINEIVLREDDYDTSNSITVLQNLKRGQPILTSYQ